MKALLAALLMIVLLVCSCATGGIGSQTKYVWENPEKTEEQLKQDERECDYEVSKAPASQPVAVPQKAWGAAMVDGMLQKNSLMEKCMGLRGYVLKKVDYR